LTEVSTEFVTTPTTLTQIQTANLTIPITEATTTTTTATEVSDVVSTVTTSMVDWPFFARQVSHLLELELIGPSS
jgi:hypothetical protein|tara:strand:- start:20894 stop:21118 length:225 start_codon:yes stop_codon:yes gene_type:complete